ncbi:MAG: hypothetical protein ACFFDI_29435 [Promethearchaeota archaeon]
MVFATSLDGLLGQYTEHFQLDACQQQFRSNMYHEHLVKAFMI